ALLLEEGDEVLGGVLEYRAELFRGETMGRLVSQYRRLLESVWRNSEQCVRDIDLLSESERRQMLVEWNRTARKYPQSSVMQMFEERVAQQPDAVALVFEERQLSYVELNRRGEEHGPLFWWLG